MLEKKKVLIVDDSKFNINLLADLLKEDYKVMPAKSGEQALNIINSDKCPDLVLLDIVMPEMDGYEVCKAIKSNDKTKDLPVIFITANTDENSIEKAYDVGGIDYISKPIKPKEVLARVKTQIEIRSLINHLEFISSYDQLTKIFNRRKFFHDAEKIFNNCNNLTGVMIDIDKFKSVNDTYGHPVGDIVLIEVVNTIKENLPTNTLFGRLGGEEFAILFENISNEMILEVLENIRKNVEQKSIQIGDNKTLNVTISSGLAQKCENISNIDNLLKEADICLYEAKNGGRNQYICRFRNT